jgi:N-acetylglucosamine-6-phosphate deacetylase
VGVIRVGSAADLVLLDRDLQLQGVFVDGKKQP